MANVEKSIVQIPVVPMQTMRHSEEDTKLIDVDEMKFDWVKEEPDDDEGSLLGMEVKSNDLKTVNVNSSQEILLFGQSSYKFLIISNLYSLLEDYKTMAGSMESFYCCQPPVCHAFLMCKVCGDEFMGKANRLMNLCKHFESEHPTDAMELILEAISKYDKLIKHMRNALRLDECLIHRK